MARPARRPPAATGRNNTRLRADVPPDSPGGRLRAVLEARIADGAEASFSSFAERIERRYHHVAHWLRNERFTPEAKGLCARALGLPPDYFGDDAAVIETARKPTEAERVLREWLRTSPWARKLSSADLRVIKGVQWHGTRPRPEVFDAMAWALVGAIPPAAMLPTAEETARLRGSLARKPPLKRRR